MKIKDLIKNNQVRFDSYRQGFFYYNIYKKVGTEEHVDIINRTIKDYPVYEIYQFTVPIDDIGTATLLATDKAITFMRWIRKAINENTLIKLP